MIDTVKLVSPLSARHQKLCLLPFFVTTIAFLLLPYPQFSIPGLILKVTPTYCLIGYVIVSRSQLVKTKTYSMQAAMPTDVYSCFVLAGLAFSSVGDCFQAAPALIVSGGTAFAIAHFAYILAIETGGRHHGTSSRCSWLFILLFLNTFLCAQSTSTSSSFSVLIFLYFVSAFLAAWKAASAMEEHPHNLAVQFGCTGGALFIVSDFVYIVSVNGVSVPFAEHIFMTTYYGAQFCWAVSTSHFN